MKKILIRSFYVATMFLLLFSACTKPINNGEDDIDYKEKLFISEVMAEYYYWNTFIPKNVQSDGLAIADHFKLLLYSKDKWSWMMTGKEFNESETGVYKSYGGYLSQAIEFYNDYSIRVAYVHPGSPFDREGVKRGWRLTHLNGTAVETLIENNTFNSVYGQSSNTFKFLNAEQQVVEKVISSETISTKSVLKKAIFTNSDFPGLPHPVGYFHYLTFNANMTDDIVTAMEEFRDAGIKDLIIDLRYNGGGDVRAQEVLCNFVAPVSANGKVLAKRKHNKQLSDMDSDTKTMTIVNSATLSLGLDRVFIITGKGSASASEVLINGLKPLMDVKHVGSKTYGKPYGMYVIGYPNNTNPTYVFLPVCFATVNMNGEGDFVDGITPSVSIADDLYHDFGVGEARIAYCLSLIMNGQGTTPSVAPKTKVYGDDSKLRLVNDYDKPGYGSYTVTPPYLHGEK